MLAAQQQATELAGRTFNLDSPKQVCALLFEELKLPALVKTPTGQPSANEEALEAIADQHELPRVILDYRSLAKLRSTYTDKLPEMVNRNTGRVHTSYHQAGAATGRLASSDPNLQNIPIRTDDGRRIRKAFVAPPGRKIVACDYSQIELRIMAHLSRGPGAAARVRVRRRHPPRDRGRGVRQDPRRRSSRNERRAAKAINFGLMYGMSAFGLAKQLGIGRGEAQDYIALYFSRYPGRARLHGAHAPAGARTRLRRDRVRPPPVPGEHRRPQPGPARRRRARRDQRADAGHRGRHHQARDDRHRRLAGRAAATRALMVLQVHDELVFEVDADFVPTLLEEVTGRGCPAAAESARAAGGRQRSRRQLGRSPLMSSR